MRHRYRAFQRACDSALDALQRWIDGLPEWLQPPMYGALIILFLIGLRALVSGILIVLPLLLIALVRSPAPLSVLGMVLGVLGLAVLGGFLAGLGYSLVGRWLRRIPLAGPYLAGLVTVLPYVCVLMVIEHWRDHTPLRWPPDGADEFTVALMSLIFGPLIGHVLFRLRRERSASKSRAA